MTSLSKLFRNRASECRALAKSARSEEDAGLLEEIASDLDDEAGKIKTESIKSEADNDAQHGAVFDLSSFHVAARVPSYAIAGNGPIDNVGQGEAS